MTSATVRQARGAGRGEGYWMVVFAASLLGVSGTFNVIDGIAAVARSSVFTANARYVIGDLRTWGWVALILGVLQLLAMLGVLAGNQAARWFGPKARSGGSTWPHSSWARGQRVRKRQPDGGAIGDGGSPTGTLSAGRTSGSGTGIASISSAV